VILTFFPIIRHFPSAIIRNRSSGEKDIPAKNVYRGSLFSDKLEKSVNKYPGPEMIMKKKANQK
jgi:hypothetical protein